MTKFITCRKQTPPGEISLSVDDDGSGVRLQFQDELAALNAYYIERGFEMSLDLGEGTPAQTRVVAIYFTRDHERIDYEFLFVESHQGRYVRVNTIEDAESYNTLDDDTVH